MGMPTAVLGTETGGFIDIRGGKHNVHAIGILGQRPGCEGIRDDALDIAVA